jgi:cytochrome c biogenesis protein CcmG/thiol:disulfide interchange protein DsbE
MSARLLFVLPLVMLLMIGGFFAWSLTSGRDPQSIGSPLVGHAAPAMDLAPLREGQARLTTASLQGQVSVVNVFASWCAPCRIEHPLLMTLAKDKSLRLVAINYKDKPADALKFLQMLGDPFAAIGSDPDGRAGLDWGLTGVPETFLLDRQGIVRLHRPGPVDEHWLRGTLLPLAAALAK